MHGPDPDLEPHLEPDSEPYSDKHSDFFFAGSAALRYIQPGRWRDKLHRLVAVRAAPSRGGAAFILVPGYYLSM